MRPGIEAVIIAIDEPQLERCLSAVHSQTRPFDQVRLVNNVVPAAAAFNLSLAGVRYRRVMYVGGDMIVDHDAAARVMDLTLDACGVYAWCFGLRDSFIDRRIAGVHVYPGDVVVRYPQPDVMRCDLQTACTARRNGLHVIMMLDCVIGSHFDDPDTDQVFRRFYVRGQKPRAAYYRRLLERRFAATGDRRFDLAIRALDMGCQGDRLNDSPNISRMRELIAEAAIA